MIYFIDYHNNPFKYHNNIRSTAFYFIEESIFVLDENYQTLRIMGDKVLLGYNIMWSSNINSGSVKYQL